MDWKSIVSNKRMKFFLDITLISSGLFLNLAYLYGAQDIPEPSHPISLQYSMRHNPQPKSADPNIVRSAWEIPFAEAQRRELSVSLPKYLHPRIEGTQHAYGHGLYIQHLLEYGHFHDFITVSTNLNCDAGYIHEEHHTDILLPILYGNSNYFSNVSSFGIMPSNNAKVTAMELKGFKF